MTAAGLPAPDSHGDRAQDQSLTRNSVNPTRASINPNPQPCQSNLCLPLSNPPINPTCHSVNPIDNLKYGLIKNRPSVPRPSEQSTGAPCHPCVAHFLSAAEARVFVAVWCKAAAALLGPEGCCCKCGTYQGR